MASAAIESPSGAHEGKENATPGGVRVRRAEPSGATVTSLPSRSMSAIRPASVGAAPLGTPGVFDGPRVSDDEGGEAELGLGAGTDVVHPLTARHRARRPTMPLRPITATAVR